MIMRIQVFLYKYLYYKKYKKKCAVCVTDSIMYAPNT